MSTRPSGKAEIIDAKLLLKSYLIVIDSLKTELDECEDYDEGCLVCRGKKARELLEEVVSLGFE